MDLDSKILNELNTVLKDGILAKWYPLVLDSEHGGYLTNLSYNWEVQPAQDKMIVSQARHVWTTSKVADFLEDATEYVEYARHGFEYLKNIQWDKEFGGFFQILSRDGGPSTLQGWRDEKRTYGSTFGLFAIAAFYKLTKDTKALEFSKQAFRWIEEHAYDPTFKGYFQFLTRDGRIFGPESEYRTLAADGNELGFKDQNSSIHLLEAYTELYRIWKDDYLRKQLQGIIELIRDTMVTEKGYLQLFFHPDWQRVSFRESSDEVRNANFGLDHVSFGHDCETAFLMLEASYALGAENDVKTLVTAKKMLDHAMLNGWDDQNGGFYDGGYYFKDSDRCTIIKDTKNWWAQAEALNALLLFSRIFPEEKQYFAYFLREWTYIKEFILDREQGDWFEGGLDKEPELRTGPKSHIWKCTYHTCRALMNCITILSDPASLTPGSKLAHHKAEMDTFTHHWQTVGESVDAVYQ